MRALLSTSLRGLILCLHFQSAIVGAFSLPPPLELRGLSFKRYTTDFDSQVERRSPKQSIIPNYFKPVPKPVPKANVPNFSRPLVKSPAPPASPPQQEKPQKTQPGAAPKPNWPLPAVPLAKPVAAPPAAPPAKPAPISPASSGAKSSPATAAPAAAPPVKPEEPPPAYKDIHVKKNPFQKAFMRLTDPVAYHDWKSDEAAFNRANHQNNQVKSGLKKFCDDSDKCYLEASPNATPALTLHKLENESRLSDYTLQKAERDSKLYYVKEGANLAGSAVGTFKAASTIRKRDLEQHLMVIRRSLMEMFQAAQDDDIWLL